MKKPRIILIIVITALFMVALAGCSDAYKLEFSQDEYTVIPGIEFTPEVKIRPRGAKYQITSANITIVKPKSDDAATVLTLREGIVDITVSSGKYSDTAKVYVTNDTDYDSGTVKFAETVTVKFVITNYELAGLSSENYGSPVSVIKSGYATFGSDPYIKGYTVYAWYKDRACTQPFGIDTEAIESDMTLYAYLEMRQTSYVVNKGLITGLTYDNLPRSVLDLPATTENGTEIIGIADNAFTGDVQITEVNIPNTYKTIGDSAFAGCIGLKRVTFVGAGAGQLEIIGINAFGITLDADKNETANCASLESIVLPDSVTEIGAYAFYRCVKLTINGIPPKVTKLAQYCFSQTNINNVNLINVTEILEGAFRNCSKLDTVTNSQNVVRCYQYAFEKIKLYYDGLAAYTPQIGAVIYADTIAFSINSTYANRDIKLKESCTLIADRAFYSDSVTDGKLYIDTAKAAQVIAENKYYYIGFDLFKPSKGNRIILPDNAAVTSYKAVYADYKGIMGYELKREISGDSDTINAGTHRILVFEQTGAPEYHYHYHKYTGSAKNIDLSALSVATYFRISPAAFSQLPDLVNLKLGDVKNVAHLAVTESCAGLIKIDLTACSSVPTLETSNAFQIYAIPNCNIVVSSGMKATFQNAWQGVHTTAYNRLKTPDEV